MRTRAVELTSEWQGKNVNMDATAKPGEIQDSEDKFRTVADENYTWDIDPSPSPEPVSATDTFTGDGDKTEFTLTDTPIEITSVKINDVATSDYTLSGNKITFNTSPADAAEIVVVYLKEA